jgi:hypothetical protein
MSCPHQPVDRQPDRTICRTINPQNVTIIYPARALSMQSTFSESLTRPSSAGTAMHSGKRAHWSGNDSGEHRAGRRRLACPTATEGDRRPPTTRSLPLPRFSPAAVQGCWSPPAPAHSPAGRPTRRQPGCGGRTPGTRGWTPPAGRTPPGRPPDSSAVAAKSRRTHPLPQPTRWCRGHRQTTGRSRLDWWAAAQPRSRCRGARPRRPRRWPPNAR